MNSQKLSSYAPLVLRLTLAGVYTWFGTSQLVNPQMWTGIVPSWATSLSGLDASTIVHLNGAMEVTAGILLALGIAVRYVAGLLFLHLVVIAANFGISSAIGMRDFGLSFSTLALALFGQDKYCLLFKGDDVSSG